MFGTRYSALSAVLVTAVLVTLDVHAGADENTGTFSGTVNLDEKPLASGRIFIHLDDGQFVGAKIKDGAFKVDRVPVGEHKVTVEFTGVLAVYTSEDKSPLRARVTTGVTGADISIRSKAGN